VEISKEGLRIGSPLEFEEQESASGQPQLAPDSMQTQ
jgi:hypothetical protein